MPSSHLSYVGFGAFLEPACQAIIAMLSPELTTLVGVGGRGVGDCGGMVEVGEAEVGVAGGELQPVFVPPSPATVNCVYEDKTGAISSKETNPSLSMSYFEV